VIGSGGGAFAITRIEEAEPASNAPAPLSMTRREIGGFFIGVSIRLFWPGAVRQAIAYCCRVQPIFGRPQPTPPGLFFEVDSRFPDDTSAGST